MSKDIEAEAKQEASKALAVVTEELDALRGWVLQTDEDQALAAEMLRDVKGRFKTLEERRKQISVPLNAALKSVNSLFKPPKDALLEAESLLKERIAGYVLHKQEENRKALEAAKEAETAEQASAALSTMVSTKAPEGVSIRYRWRPQVIDRDAIPREWLMLDMQAIQQYADRVVKESGKPPEIAGLTFVKESTVSSRSS